MPAHHHCQLDHELRRYPGITCGDYWRLFHLQGKVCRICKRPPGKWRFAVDRDHATGVIRGLTHHRCNRPITEDVVYHVLNPLGAELGLYADPVAVAKMEARQRKRARRKAKPRKRTTSSTPTSTVGERIADLAR
jgi:Recombination endonuclease VII